MKQKEMIIVGMTALITAILSIVLSGVLFGSPQKNAIKVPTVTKISSDFPTPQTDKEYTTFFNDNALDPTRLIQIGTNDNKAVFQTGQ